MLLKILKEIPDNRGKKGRQYENWAVLFIAILAMISGANSYSRHSAPEILSSINFWIFMAYNGNLSKKINLPKWKLSNLSKIKI